MGVLVFTLYEIGSGCIRQSGYAPSIECLPEKPDGCEFAFGIEGNPETQRVEFSVVDGEAIAFLVDYQREYSQDELVGRIEEERTRRLCGGFDYDFGDERGIHRIGTTEADERGWDKVTKLSTAYLLSGNPDALIQIVTDTGPVSVTAAEWQMILIAAGAFQQPIYALSFALQAMTPIPQNVESPEYWA